MAFAVVRVSNVNVPLGPSVDRCSSKPVSFGELSRQVRLTWLLAASPAVRFDGALEPPNAASNASWSSGPKRRSAELHEASAAAIAARASNRTVLERIGRLL